MKREHSPPPSAECRPLFTQTDYDLYSMHAWFRSSIAQQTDRLSDVATTSSDMIPTVGESRKRRIDAAVSVHAPDPKYAKIAGNHSAAVKERDLSPLPLKQVQPPLPTLRTNMPMQPSPQLQTQLPTQLQTQIPTQLQTQIPTQLQTQIPTQLQTQIPTQLQTQIPTQLQTQIPTQLQTQIPTQLQTQISTQLQTQIPTQPQTQISTQLQTQIPTQPQTHISTQLQTQISTQLQTQIPTQIPTQPPKILEMQVIVNSPFVRLRSPKTLTAIGVNVRPEFEAQKDSVTLTNVGGNSK